MKVLVTGFEPWDKWDRNPSGEVAEELDGQSVCGAQVVSAVLPVVYGEDTRIVLPLIDNHRPNVVLSLGLGGSTCLNIERVSINLKQDDRPIVAEGPAAYFATIPTRRICEAIQAAGVPARLSYHAGTFLCNHIMYSVLHHSYLDGRHPICGFIHVPPTPDLVGAEGGSSSSMSLQKIQEGVVLAIENLVTQQK